MSISGIFGPATSYVSPYSNAKKTAQGGVDGENRNTGPDTVSFSPEALVKALGQGVDAAESDEDGLSFDYGAEPGAGALQGQSGASASRLMKKNLFSIMLESLFLAELEESTSNADTASSGNADASAEQAGAQPSGQTRSAKAGSLLQDGSAVAEIKKVLADFSMGKADLSDLPKAMAAGATHGTGGVKGVARNSQPGAASDAGGDKDKARV